MQKVLLVEDHADLRELLQDALEAAGYDVVAVADGGAALEAARGTPVNVVISDLYMPGMEGLETISELRERYPEMKIIAISGGSTRIRGAQADHLQIARHIGADAALRKPFAPATLIDVVQRLIG